MTSAVDPDEALAALDSAGPERARAELSPCCASGRWIDEIIEGRPYVMVGSLIAASDAALASLTWADVLEALAAHPKIGAAATGRDREAAWSRQEQAGTSSADEAVRERLAAANRAYQDRFGYGFLICATGRSAADLLTALEQRLGNDPDKEQDVVREELAAIVRLRLEKAFGLSLSTHVLDATAGHPAAGVAVTLEHLTSDDWALVSEHTTDQDGRIGQLAGDLTVGSYRLRFDTDAYFGGETFYPEVTVTFRVIDPHLHLHVPLLLSPWAYTTYRGS